MGAKCLVKISHQLFPKKIDVANRDNPFRIFACTLIECEGELPTNSNSIIVKGDLSFLEVGESYTLTLEENEPDRYGTSYSVKEVHDFTSLENLTREESEIILLSITSKQNAKTLLDYDDKIILRLVTEGAKNIDLSKLYNIKKVKIACYERKLKGRYLYYGIMQSNKQYRITTTDCKILVEKYATTEKVTEELQNNPYYVLINVLGRSFLYKTSSGEYLGVDKLLSEVRPDLKSSFIRGEFLVAHILKLNEIGGFGFKGGNTRLSKEKLLKSADKYAPELSGLMDKILNESLILHYDEKYVANIGTYMKEVKCDKFIKSLIENNSVLDLDYEKYTKVKDGNLTDEQKGLLESFCKNRLTILDGGAGCGKTASLKALLEMLDDNQICYTCLTPTGLSSKVLSSLTSRPSSTIHRCALRDFGTDAQVVIVDEFSMVGLKTMSLLIDCILKKDIVRLVLVGDSAQMTPVLDTSIFYELLQFDKVSKTSLTKVFRYKDGGASKVSADTRFGKLYIEPQDYGCPHIVYGSEKDYEFIECKNSIKQIVEVYQATLDKYKLLPRDLTILTSYNIMPLGSININNAIQSLVNPPNNPKEKTISIRKSGTEIAFRKGSLVLNTKNNYDIMTKEMFEELQSDSEVSREDLLAQSVEIVNGDIGEVVEVFDNFLEVQFDDNLVVLTRKEVNHLLLAYCLNYPKSQGSSFSYVINVVAEEHSRNISRQGLYVAQTRQRKKLIEIGDLDTIKKALATNIVLYQDCYLREMLKGEINYETK